MKMIKSDYVRLEELINICIKRSGIKPHSDYKMSHEWYRWDIYYATLDYLQYNSREDYIFMRSLYDYCNDDHIDTALRRIIA